MSPPKIISLKSSHLHLENDLVTKIFRESEHAYTTYMEKQNKLLLTPITSQWFLKMYENPVQLFLKSRNLRGDKSISIRGILIDNNLDLSDRFLDFEWIEKTNLLKINL